MNVSRSPRTLNVEWQTHIRSLPPVIQTPPSTPPRAKCPRCGGEVKWEELETYWEGYCLDQDCSLYGGEV